MEKIKKMPCGILSYTCGPIFHIFSIFARKNSLIVYNVWSLIFKRHKFNILGCSTDFGAKVRLSEEKNKFIYLFLT